MATRNGLETSSGDDAVVDTRRLDIGCEFVYRAEIPTPTIFQVEPLADLGVSVAEAAWSFEPEAPRRRYADLYGNPCTRTVLPAGVSTLRYRAVATVPDVFDDADESAPEVPAEQLPDDVLLYTLPSRFALPDLLGNEAWQRFAAVAPGYQRVQAICDHVHDHLTFQYGSSLATSTAMDVFTSGYGVCRDFTHLAISYCRALNIPHATCSATCPTWTCLRTRHRWTSRRGWRSGWVTAGGPSTRATTPGARGGS